MQFKVKSKFRGFNILGKNSEEEYEGDKKYTTSHLSDLELLRFYMNLANESIFLPNSAGWHRMIMICDKVRANEAQIDSGYNKKGAYIGYLKKNKKQRMYVRGLIKEVSSANKLFN